MLSWGTVREGGTSCARRFIGRVFGAGLTKVHCNKCQHLPDRIGQVGAAEGWLNVHYRAVSGLGGTSSSSAEQQQLDIRIQLFETWKLDWTAKQDVVLDTPA
jgi:hypothetical protein